MEEVVTLYEMLNTILGDDISTRFDIGMIAEISNRIDPHVKRFIGEDGYERLENFLVGHEGDEFLHEMVTDLVDLAYLKAPNLQYDQGMYDQVTLGYNLLVMMHDTLQDAGYDTGKLRDRYQRSITPDSADTDQSDTVLSIAGTNNRKPYP